MKRSDIIAYLGSERFARLGEIQEGPFEIILQRAPNIPTAAIWTLQLACIAPSEDDLKRWSADVAKLQEPTTKPRKS
jgi:hypothetical protein